MSKTPDGVSAANSPGGVRATRPQPSGFHDEDLNVRIQQDSSFGNFHVLKDGGEM